MTNKKISIIIPVYNAEKYVKKCLISIINQIYSNIEIIIINDGSTDNSEEIIGKFRDNRIVYEKISNHGVSYARNIGLKKSTGDYIMFVDSDDYIDRYMIEK